MHYNFREWSESAKEERVDEEKNRAFQRGRLSGRMTDGWSKGERKEKMNWANYRACSTKKYPESRGPFGTAG